MKGKEKLQMEFKKIRLKERKYKKGKKETA